MAKISEVLKGVIFSSGIFLLVFRMLSLLHSINSFYFATEHLDNNAYNVSLFLYHLL